MLAWHKAISLAYVHAWMKWHYFIGLSKIKTVDSAQPRNRQTPFLVKGRGLGTRLHQPLSQTCTHMQAASLFWCDNVLVAGEEGLLHENIDHVQRDGRTLCL